MNLNQLPVASTREVFSMLNRCSKPYRIRMFITCTLLVTATVSVLATTYFLGAVVDAIGKDDFASELNRIGITIIGLVLLAGVTGFVGRLQLARVVEKTLANLRVEAFTAALHLRLDTVERVGTADPLSRLTGDVGTITDGAHDVIPSAIIAVLTMTLTFVALFVTSPLLGAAALLLIPSLYISIRWYIRNSPAPYRVEQESYAHVTRLTHETSEGASTIRAYGNQYEWLNKSGEVLDYQWDVSWAPARLRVILFPVSILSIFIGLGSVLCAGYFFFQSGRISLGVVSAAALYVVQLATPIPALLDSLNVVQQAIASATRIVGISFANSDDVTARSQTPQNGTVDLRDVHFAYNDDQEVLHGVSFSVSEGERVAVVGPSGAGKSTIAKIISGIHEPQQGSVTVGGVSVSDISQTSTRRCIALVTQEAHVFIGTIAENCRIGNNDATDEMVRSALTTVHALGWVEDLPEGIDTQVGRTGIRLTLVQSQQVALARVLLADPLVVILDEATAGLGSDAARGIEQSFAAVLEGRTVITIAHRLDVAASSDRVIVVEKGNIETGTHDELLAAGSTYARLWNHSK